MERGVRDNSGRRTIDDVPSAWNTVTEGIIASAIEVHTHLGPGMLEKIYEQAMVHELSLRRLRVGRERAVKVAYKGLDLGSHVLDIVVEDLVVVELKSVDAVHDVHLRQLVSYMRSGGYPLGLLINFNVARLKDGLYRRVASAGVPIPMAMLENQ